MSEKRQQTNRVVEQHVLWSMGAGLIPVPLLDLVGVAAVQHDMLRQLTKVYGADYDQSAGKVLVSALTGSSLARMGASAVKALPGVGTTIGTLSMPILSGASTYGIGQVAIEILEDSGSLEDVDFDAAKEAYKSAFERGKKVATGMKSRAVKGEDVFEKLERLGDLREKGVITGEEFDAQKVKLLERL